MTVVVSVLLWFCAIACGLLAGVYFAFSTFVMTALGRIDPVHGVSAMNAINIAILRSPFMPLFFGTTLASLALVGMALFRWGEPGAAAMLAAGVIYVPGMFLCTMFFNVPLNNALTAVEPASAAAAPVWTRYLQHWTLWNHARTIASTVACALYIAALMAG